MNRFCFVLLLLLGWCLPAFAASTPTSDTPVVVIMDGYAQRSTAGTLVETVLGEGITSTIQANGGVKTTLGVGTASGTGVTAVEYGEGTIHSTTLTFAATPLTVRDTEQGGGLLAYTFPQGRVLILGATGNMQFTTTSALATTLNAGVSSRWGLGTVTQSQATLTTTEQDLLPVATFTSSATIDVPSTAVPSALASSAQFDGTTTAKAAFLNVSVPGATDIDADATIEANGWVKITWINLGDY